MKATFQGEVLFAGYADGSRGGPRVTFRLADRDDLAEFIGMEGKRFMAVLVEIADDETPAEPEPAARPAAKRAPMPPLLDWTVKRCDEVAFQQWCFETLTGSFFEPFVGRPTRDAARAAVLHLCGVDSRKRLDESPEAAKRFHERVRVPYSAWLAKRPEFQREEA